jgi:F0F1-type ATP synthase membrane subunit c/vacuolar-type H+-ATPase subunit K
MSEKNNHKETKTIGVGIAIGIGMMTPFGIILSVTTGNIAFIGAGLPLGIAIGTAIGVALNERDKV